MRFNLLFPVYFLLVLGISCGGHKNVATLNSDFSFPLENSAILVDYEGGYGPPFAFLEPKSGAYVVLSGMASAPMLGRDVFIVFPEEKLVYSYSGFGIYEVDDVLGDKLHLAVPKVKDIIGVAQEVPFVVYEENPGNTGSTDEGSTSESPPCKTLSFPWEFDLEFPSKAYCTKTATITFHLTQGACCQYSQ